MNFLISDTFSDSLTKLTGEEQKAVKTTAFDLQMNLASPGLQFHKLEKSRDPNFWSVRVSLDIRIIVHRTGTSLLLCYVGHHDDAYNWAERRKLETHPKTGAAQLVEVRETFKEIIVPKYVEDKRPVITQMPLFADYTDEQLLKYGVPVEWLADVRAADEESILELADHLPQEAAEALLDIAVGATPRFVPVSAKMATPFDHPDAQRRFRNVKNIEELELALNYPWEKWTIFLHPDQRQLVERDYSGPTRVSGSAGTGKTIVALHRAVYLARANSEARVLLTTFSDALANALRTKLKRLISSEPRLAERLEVHDINEVGRRLYERHFGRPQMASADNIKKFLAEAAKATPDHKFTAHFLFTEWVEVVDAWQLDSWEAYRDVTRLGRKTRLPENQRVVLWSIFELVRAALSSKGLITYASLFCQLADRIGASKHPPYDFTVIDEAQDVNIGQLRFLAALGGTRANALFFSGDLGQRIFQQPFSWKSLGVDVRGRSRTLKVNYRTSHQIRAMADRLLASEISDVDGNEEERKGTVSVFNGQKPTILELNSPENEIEAAAEWLKARTKDGVSPYEIGVFVRSEKELPRARKAAEVAGLPYKVLDETVETVSGYASVSTMHLAKGLEFRAVVVMACDAEVIPLQERIEAVSDDTDLEEVYNTERHLLYVAATRARDHLLISSGGESSEFLDDLGG